MNCKLTIYIIHDLVKYHHIKVSDFVKLVSSVIVLAMLSSRVGLSDLELRISATHAT